MQDFINKHFFELFLVTWIFGIVFYGVIRLDFIDELCAAVLLLMFLFYVFKTPDWRMNKMFLFTLFVFFFYLGYSIYIKSNTTKSILIDFLIQLKPYLAFFCAYQLSPKFTKDQKKLLKDVSCVVWFLLCFLGFSSLIDPKLLFKVMSHPTAFAAAVVSTSLVYLYSSEYTMKDKLIFLGMLSLGIFSGRAKFYGFLACSVVAVLYFSSPKNLRFSTRNIVMFAVMFILIVGVAWEKIEFYFVQGATGEEKDYLARFVLYITAATIFLDYLPFGSGFASFATHASRVDYSPTYSEYGIDNVWGLSKSYSAFIADTYYPSLAQFGVVGVALYVLFWVYVLKKAFRYFQRKNSTRLLILSMLIIGYLTIENVADATFTSNRGLFMMMFLGLILSEQKGDELAGQEEKMSELIPAFPSSADKE